MATTFIADIRHYLDNKGMLPSDIPKPAINIASFLAKIIEAVTFRPSDTENYSTEVKCRRRPGHKQCVGEIVAFIDKENDSRIRWFCPFCQDNGYISGWQGTKWNRSKIIYHQF